MFIFFVIYIAIFSLEKVFIVIKACKCFKINDKRLPHTYHVLKFFFGISEPLMYHEWIYSFKEEIVFDSKELVFLCFWWIHKLKNLWRHPRHYWLEAVFSIFSLESSVNQKDIWPDNLQLIKFISNLFSALLWKLWTNPRPFYDS